MREPGQAWPLGDLSEVLKSTDEGIEKMASHQGLDNLNGTAQFTALIMIAERLEAIADEMAYAREKGYNVNIKEQYDCTVLTNRTNPTIGTNGSTRGHHRR